ncbi:hypothetical protein M4D54_08460 [Brachybacterium sp. p3-SID1565]|uniref:Uncharacterized protein n=1 Tax=Brachybacterium epidermidis TaxID=2781983 RepID=A0ABR9W3X1_9MICO|nr:MULTISPECIES: hypothetical protein [Brachybacterium]MBE9405140.1 hypothetical protein [Brachybacterium epidermidis]MCT1385655.1 hypothetical protein [Brachybacterium sp. p3-SID1565]
MTAVSPMVLLLLGVAALVAVLMVLVATGRLGQGIDLPRRPRGPRRRRRRAAASGTAQVDRAGPGAET